MSWESVQKQLAEIRQSVKVAKALDSLREEIAKAAPGAPQVLTKDKKVDPTHDYAFREGDKENPRFYYTDQAGNYLRYTNAPNGHEEASKYYGDAQPHPYQPMFESNPEYFTPDGLLLTRCPDCDPTQVEWNQSYNQYDPQNLWIGRWRNMETGQQEYTYLDADIRRVPKLALHQSNALTDVRLPEFRAYYADLYGSDKIKDQTTALMLAFLDQGRMRATELAMLSAGDVEFSGTLIRLGKRWVSADYRVQLALESLKNSRMPDEPLFTVPAQKKDGTVDPSLRRRLGPHYLGHVVDQQGLSLLGLQAYHATLTFSREMSRALTQYQADWNTATQFALMVVALEWGHDFTIEFDAARVLQLMQAVLIDPVVVEVLEQNLKDHDHQGPPREMPPAMIPIHHVSFELVDRTFEEAEFSSWLHAHPIHEHAEFVQ